MFRRRLMAATMALMLAGVTTFAQGQRGKDWDLLGERTVTDRGDHDTIAVTGARGTFTAVKFEVRNHAVDFQRVVIHFGNGDVQDVELRNIIPAGGKSRVIDIEGHDRVIKTIEFVYDAQALGGRTARVRVFGKN